jgi:hypothetical protein
MCDGSAEEADWLIGGAGTTPPDLCSGPPDASATSVELPHGFIGGPSVRTTVSAAAEPLAAAARSFAMLIAAERVCLRQLGNSYRIHGDGSSWEHLSGCAYRLSSPGLAGPSHAASLRLSLSGDLGVQAPTPLQPSGSGPSRAAGLTPTC